MVNGFALLVLIGFGVGITVLLKRSIFTQYRSDLLSLAAEGKDGERANALKVLRSLRARTLVAVAAMASGGAAALVLHVAFPASAGLPLAAAPAGMWVLAALVFAGWRLPHEFANPPTESSLSVSAELTPRSTGMFGPAWGIVMPAVLLGASILGLVVAGLLSGTDERGRFRNLTYMSTGGAVLDDNRVVTQVQLGVGSVSPFPGWYYGIPILALLLLGAGLSLWALNANARRPRIRGLRLLPFDDGVRTNAGYVISTGFSAMLCFQIAPLMFFAAAALRSSGMDPGYVVGQVLDENSMPSMMLDPVLGALALAMAVVALLLLVVGAVLLVRLLGWMGATLRPLRLPATAAAIA
ncbi:hypothetical protein ACIPVK_20855 [Paeniglutamicibacter sp. MACA_103]|uniref:hypothetical protein n=1 Tax=Paeniglutamicibacter sp. MACA_103 TaxID=3377337 RepID=UPI003895BC47